MGRQEELSLTTEIGQKRLEITTRLGTKTIDMIALTASFAWVGAMLGLSLRGGESSVFMWLIRGMWGAIFVYAIVYLALHAITTKTVISDEKDSSASAQANTAPNVTEPAEQATVEQATVDLQAADSGELAKVVAQNVSEQL